MGARQHWQLLQAMAGQYSYMSTRVLLTLATHDMVRKI